MAAEDEDREQETTVVLQELFDTVAVAALKAVLETTLDEALSAMLGSITVVPTSLQDKTAALAKGGDLPDLVQVLTDFSECAKLGDVPAPVQSETSLPGSARPCMPWFFSQTLQIPCSTCSSRPT